MTRRLLSFVFFVLFSFGLNAQCLPPGSTCDQAPFYCGNYLENIFTGNTGGYFPAFNLPFCGTLENTQFLKIVPCSNVLTVTVFPFNCQNNNGVQIGLLDNCQNNQVIACDGGLSGGGFTPLSITAGVTPGEVYTLVIDGYAGDICDFDLDLDGVDTNPPSSSTVAQNGSIEFQTLPCGPATLTAHLPVCVQNASPGCSGSWTDFYVDSCLGIQWNLPPGVQIVSPDPNAFTITVQFTQQVTNGIVSAGFTHNCLGINDATCSDCIPKCCQSGIPPITISSPASTYTDVPCSSAPLFCAASAGQISLNNGCTFGGFNWWQSDLWNLLGPCFSLENPNLYAIGACGDQLNLDISVSNCVNDHGLEFALMAGDGCNDLYTVANCISINEGGAGQIHASLIGAPADVYFLVVDGIGLDACDFNVTTAQLDASGQPVADCQFGYNPFLQVIDSTYTVTFFVNSFPGTQITGNSGTVQNGVFVSAPIPCDQPYSFVITVDSCEQIIAGDSPCLPPPVCPFFNIPAPPADSCHNAPLLCGSFLEHYCSTNAGLTPDQGNVILGNVPAFENNGWLRAVACSDSVAIDFQVFDCQNGNELGFFLLTGDCDTLTLKSFASAKDSNIAHLTATGITPGEPFFIVVDGFFGATCMFKTHVVNGIGTAEPGPSTCTCTDAYIDGPDDFCPGDIATFTFVPANCTVTTGPPVGGNGIYCLPPPESCNDTTAKDSTVLHWVVPPYMTYLSDSVNVYSITVQIDSSLIGIDTMLTDTISVYFEHIPLPPDTTVQQDTQSYCACLSFPPCDWKILPKIIHVHHKVLYDYGSISCVQPCYIYNGNAYCNPGKFLVSQNHCLTQYLVISGDITPPFVNAGADQTICDGGTATLGGPPLPGYTYDWTGGLNTSVINVSPSVTTTYTLTVTNNANGCTAADAATVFVTTALITNLGPVSVCEGDCVVLGWGEVMCPAQPGVFANVLLSSQGCDSIVSQAVIVKPFTVKNLGIVGTITCALPCVTFHGKEYCQPGMYTDTVNCVINQFQINQDPSLPTIQLGVVGTITCAQADVVYNGQTFSQPGTYSDTSNCIINQFQIAFDSSLPVVQLGTVGTLSCAQSAVIYNGQTYTQPGAYSDTSNCAINQFQILFDPTLQTFQLGVVGAITCGQPCVTFNGQNYCQPGMYSDTANCTVSQFEVTYDPSLPVTQSGVVGTITCAQPAVVFNGQTYTQPGVYSDTLNCTINQFQILFDASLPVSQLGVVGTLSCQQPCTAFNGKTYCQPGLYSDTVGCTINQFEITFDPSLSVSQLGVVGTITCSQPSVTFNGQAYTQPGMYSDTSNCAVSLFEIALDASLPVSQLGVVGTITCPQPSVTFNGQAYTQPGMYSDTTNCAVSLFEITSDLTLTTVQLGVVGTLTCAQPGFVFNGQAYTQAGMYADTVNCQIQEFEIAYDSLLPTVQLGVVGTLTCAQPCVSYNGENFCLSGTYTQVANCEIQQFVIEDQAAVFLDLGVDQTITAGDLVEIQAQTNAQPVSVTWYSDQQVVLQSGLTLQVSPPQTTLYSIEIQDINGCLLEDSVTVFVIQKNTGWYAPNVFKPGSGSQNEWFTLYTATDVITEIRSLDIYDRWGERVWTKAGFAPGIPELGWDGSSKGKILTPAVFVWTAVLVFSDGTTTEAMGEVTLLR